MAHFALVPTNRFDILDEESLDAQPPAPRQRGDDPDTAGILRELPIEHCGKLSNSSAHCPYQTQRAVPAQLEPSTVSLQAAPRSSHRRPIIEPDTFEPPTIVQEESSWLDALDGIPRDHAADFAATTQPAGSTLSDNDENAHPLRLLNAKESVATQVDKQLAATPLDGDAHAILDRVNRGSSHESTNMDAHLGVSSLRTPVKSSAVVEVVEQMLSPPLTIGSDRSTSLHGAHSPSESALSSPRIEDSLAEIDKLEDELEAMNLYASSQSKGETTSRTGQGPTDKLVRTPNPAKRVTISSQPATMRIKSSEKLRPSLRRSSSLTFRDKTSRPLEDIPEQKVPGSLNRSKSTTFRSSVLSKAGTVKSTKPPTIPNFELPGEAVSRRLKEQREARQAQQAEAQRPAATQKPRLHKPLTRPNFELPGEAISRRKREQHEAKIKAQEEEEKKRREFRARPVRHSIGPSTLPRETITSRARQNKDNAKDQRDNLLGSTTVRLPGRAIQTLPRGRNSLILPPESESRATSASASSVGGQRSTVSAEDALQQRIRAREIFTRDNSFTQTREQAKREKETAAQLARAEAAERSRALSREWAEKKRRKELSLRQAMRESLQPDAAG